MKATPKDLAALDRLIKPPEPPERIYGWLDSQLSIARFYGGMTYRGFTYSIAHDEPQQPLVRGDVLRKEAKSKAAKKRSEKQAVKLAQGALI